MPDKDIHVCPKFQTLIDRGMGETHYMHKRGGIVPQWTYSINGYLGSCRTYWPGSSALKRSFIASMPPGAEPTNFPHFVPVREGYGVVKRNGLVENNPAQVFSFSEENILWDIDYRSRPNETLGINNVLVSRFSPVGTGDSMRNIWLTYPRNGGKDLFPMNYRDAFATFHLPPSDEINLELRKNYGRSETVPDWGKAYYAKNTGSDYPGWGLCRGSANAVFLDQHVQSIPYWADTHNYTWPLRNRIPRTWTIKH